MLRISWVSLGSDKAFTMRPMNLSCLFVQTPKYDIVSREWDVEVDKLTLNAWYIPLLAFLWSKLRFLQWSETPFQSPKLLMHFEPSKKLLNFNFGSDSNGANTQCSQYAREHLSESNLVMFRRFDATDFTSTFSICDLLTCCADNLHCSGGLSCFLHNGLQIQVHYLIKFGLQIYTTIWSFN